MSFLETQVLGLAGTAVGKLLQIKPSRRFEAFSDFCSITETHNMAVTATQYPIEDGTQGTDHIVREPKTLRGMSSLVSAQTLRGRISVS